MKSYTSIEQSKKLAEILPFESADMILYGIYCGMDGQYHHLRDEYNKFGTIAINKEFCKTLFKIGDEYVDWLHCWSLTALLSVLPYPSLHKTFSGWRCDSYNKEGTSCILGETTDNLIDTCVTMIETLHELKML